MGVISKETGITLYLRGGSTPSYNPTHMGRVETGGILPEDGRRRTGVEVLPVESRSDHEERAENTRAFESHRYRGESMRALLVKAVSADVSKNRKIVRGYYNYALSAFRAGTAELPPVSITVWTRWWENVRANSKSSRFWQPGFADNGATGWGAARAGNAENTLGRRSDL